MRNFRYTIGIMVVVMTAFASFAEDYVVKFDRSMKVGDKYGVSGAATEDVAKTISADGKIIRDEKSKSKVSIIADVSVLKVNKRGRPIAVACVIKSMEVERDGKTSPSLAKDSLVEITVVDKRQVCKIKGSEIPPAVAKPLNSVIRLAKFDSTDEDVFGTDKPRKVGEKWNVDKKRMIADMATTGLQLSPTNIEGSAKLLRTITVDGRECVLVETQFKLNKLTTPKLPPSLKIKSADMKVVSQTTLPIDNVTPIVASDDTMTIILVMEGAMNPKAPKMRIEVRNEKKRTLRYGIGNLKLEIGK